MSRRPKPPTGQLTLAEVTATIAALNFRLVGELDDLTPAQVRAMERALAKLQTLRDAAPAPARARVFDANCASCACSHSLSSHEHAAPHPCFYGATAEDTRMRCDCRGFHAVSRAGVR